MAQGVNKLVKFMLFFFNFIFFLCGLIIIIASSFFLANRNEYSHFTGESGIAVAAALICVGVFIFLTGFFGCCGAMRENYCMLFTYAVIIFCLLLVQIAAGITGFVLRKEISDEIENSMHKELMKYKNDTGIQKAYDELQEGLKCCGASNYTDWFADGVLYSNNSVPASCCIEKTCNHYDIPESEEEAKKVIHTEGCANELKKTLHDNMMAIIIACIVIGLIEITGIFCSCCLMKSVKNEYEVV